MAASLWWTILVFLMIVSAGLMLKLKMVGGAVAALLLYVYLQASGRSLTDGTKRQRTDPVADISHAT